MNKIYLFLGFLTLSVISCATTSSNNESGLEMLREFSIVIQSGHSTNVTKAAVSPDGKYYATGGQDGLTLIWRSEDGVLINRIADERGSVESLAFFDDGHTMITCNIGNGFHIRDYLTGKSIREVRWLYRYGHDIAVSPDEDYFIIAGGSTEHDEGYLYRVNRKNLSNAEIKKYEIHAMSACYSPDGTKYYVGLQNGEIYCYDAKTDKKIWQQKIYSDSISAMDCNGFGSLITGNNLSRIQAFDGESGELLNERNLKAGSINSLEFNDTGDRFLAGTENRVRSVKETNHSSRVHIIQTENLIPLNNMPQQEYPVHSAAWDNHRDRIIAGSGKWGLVGEVLCWEENGETAWRKDSVLFPMTQVISEPERLSIQGGYDTDIFRRFNNSTFSFESTFFGHDKISIPLSDGNLLCGSRDSSHLQVIDPRTGEIISRINDVNVSSSEMVYPRISRDGRYVLFISNRKNNSSYTAYLILWDLSRNQEVFRKTFYETRIREGLFNSDNGKLYIAANRINPKKQHHSLGSVQIIDINTKELLREKSFETDVMSLDLSPDREHLAVGLGFTDSANASAWILGSEKLNLVRKLNEHGALEVVRYSPDGNRLAVGYTLSLTSIWGLDPTNPPRRTKILNSNAVLSADWSEDGKYLYTASEDGTIQIWNTETDEIATLIVTDQDWVIYTQDGYFDSSENGGALIAMVKDGEAFGVDQFALRNNRPDIIMDRFGVSAMPEIHTHYNNLYLKRLRQAGIREQDLSEELHTPAAEILNAEISEDHAVLNLHFSDSREELVSYNIWINDVPLFGAAGKEISGMSAEITESVTLTDGKNKLEIGCINSKGAESFRPVKTIDLDLEQASKLWFLGFGVSDYINDDLNLQYAAKDIRDMESLFRDMEGKAYNQVHTKTYTDAEVSREAFSNAAEFLAEADVSDTVILAVAGHGMYSDDSNYYFLTHIADLSNIQGTCVSFDTIENLLQGIPPRKKLFLMDTCESGVQDKSSSRLATNLTEQTVLSARGLKAINRDEAILPESLPSVSYLNERDRYIHNDLFRRSGAIVFSSSRGNEFSYESQDIENGYFTESILLALMGKADTNGDLYVDNEELRNYVSGSVSEATSGAQNPTIDRDNIYQEIIFPVLAK